MTTIPASQQQPGVRPVAVADGQTQAVPTDDRPARPGVGNLSYVVNGGFARWFLERRYVSASAMLIEAGLSFLGAGVPLEVPSWGNIISQGKTFFQIAPWTILIPGAFLAVTVLAVNLLGDGLRDRLDPRLARRL